MDIHVLSIIACFRTDEIESISCEDIEMDMLCSFTIQAKRVGVGRWVMEGRKVGGG